MMKNLDQIRAENALTHARPVVGRRAFDKADVNKLPALIQSCGLLATAAFADEDKESRRGMRAAMDAIAKHLAHSQIRCLDIVPNQASTATLINELVKQSSQHLIAATAEAQAFLAYLKRFTHGD